MNRINMILLDAAIYLMKWLIVSSFSIQIVKLGKTKQSILEI